MSDLVSAIEVEGSIDKCEGRSMLQWECGIVLFGVVIYLYSRYWDICSRENESISR